MSIINRLQSIYEEMEAYFASNEFKEEQQKKAERDAFLNELYTQWYARWNKLSLEEKKALVRKINAKYNSDSYKDRWYKRNIEPQNELLWVLYQFAECHGQEFEDGYTGFVSFCNLLDDEFIVTRHDGQGSFVTVYCMEEGLKEIERLNKIDKQYE